MVKVSASFGGDIWEALNFGQVGRAPGATGALQRLDCDALLPAWSIQP